MKINLKQAAKKFKNWSLYKLAQEMNIPRQTIYSWQNQRTEPSFNNLDKICNLLECNINDILEHEKINQNSIN